MEVGQQAARAGPSQRYLAHRAKRSAAARKMTRASVEPTALSALDELVRRLEVMAESHARDGGRYTGQTMAEAAEAIIDLRAQLAAGRDS